MEMRTNGTFYLIDRVMYYGVQCDAMPCSVR